MHLLDAILTNPIDPESLFSTPQSLKAYCRRSGDLTV
jgi:hypothetical protein